MKDTLTFNIGTATVNLVHGESITLTDLPGSLRFTITENAEDANGYQTTYTVNSGSPETGREATGTLADNPEVAFVNTRQVMVPTDVFDGAAWFAPALLLILPALGILILRKRRRSREED